MIWRNSSTEAPSDVAPRGARPSGHLALLLIVAMAYAAAVLYLIRKNTAGSRRTTITQRGRPFLRTDRRPASDGSGIRMGHANGRQHGTGYSSSGNAATIASE